MDLLYLAIVSGFSLTDQIWRLSMFQTELVIFIQSYSNDFLDAFFTFITSLGYSTFTKPFIIVVIFGLNYRMGFLLLHLGVWNGIATDVLKELFALPRPANVDSAVQLLGKDYPNPTQLEGMGAKSFFGLLPRESIEFIRANRFDSYGFPSGHTSGSVTIWGGVSLIFKRNWLTIICVAMMLLIPFSRMYLGRHFLADILGGYILGSSFLYMFYRYVFYNERLKDFVFNIGEEIKRNTKTILFILYSFFVPLLLLLTPKIDPDDSATLLGVNIGFFMIRLRGVPSDEGSVARRICRVLIVFILFYGIYFFYGRIAELHLVGDSIVFEYISNVIIMGFLVWSSTEINIKFGLMNRDR